MPNSILPQDQDGQELFNAIISFFCTFGMSEFGVIIVSAYDIFSFSIYVPIMIRSLLTQ